MKKNLSIWLVLIALTILSALAANNLIGFEYLAAIILGFSILKFIGVAFYFMDLKDAHPFWKTIVLIFVGLFSVITLALV